MDWEQYEIVHREIGCRTKTPCSLADFHKVLSRVESMATAAGLDVLLDDTLKVRADDESVSVYFDTKQDYS